MIDIVIALIVTVCCIYVMNKIIKTFTLIADVLELHQDLLNQHDCIIDKQLNGYPIEEVLREIM